MSWLLLLVCVGQLTPPPLVPGDVPLEPSPPAPATKAPPAPDATTAALHVAPVSLAATHLTFELEKAVSPTVTVFGGAGASLLLMVTGELGLRVYLSPRALEGPFLSVQGSVLYFARSHSLLVGPAGLFGYAFAPKERLMLTVGAGVQAWHQPTADTGLSLLGLAPHSSIIVLAGVQRPASLAWAAQPVLRFTVGPRF